MSVSLLEDIFADAIARMDPEARVRAALASIGRADDAVGLAIGKAACAMARGAAAACARGLVIAPSACVDAPWPVMIGAHPVPDASSVAAGQAAIALVRSVPASGTLVALISGGASALAEAPRGTLDELVAAVRAVVASGAPIAEINRVRQGLSQIKGGGLARMCAGRVVTLVASDVVGDDPAVVGSGPTVVPGGTTIVIAGLGALAQAAVDAAASRGVGASIVDDAIADDVDLVAARIAGAIDTPGPPLLVFAGEPTITLPAHPGVGGRAQHLALLVARALAGRDGWSFVACGSDGIDGTGPAAGARVDGATWGRAPDADRALAARDAGTALAAAGALITTGRTGVNHADLMLLLRRPA